MIVESDPVIGAEVLFALFGHPPKKCKLRTGVITSVQGDLFLVQDPKYTKPIPFDRVTKLSVPDVKRCTGCDLLIRETLSCPQCEKETLVAVNRLPSRYYIHKITLLVDSE